MRKIGTATGLEKIELGGGLVSDTTRMAAVTLTAFRPKKTSG